MGLFKPRPKARIKIGQHFMGEKTSTTAEGYVIYKEWDASDKQFYYWEEWELRGFKDFDSWIEYDHYTKKVTLYEPMKLKTPIDPMTLHTGQQLTIEIDDLPTQLTVKEAGDGVVARIEGTLSYHVFLNETMRYAEINVTNKRGGWFMSAERYNTVEFDTYRGKVLSKRDQKRILGRIVEPWPITAKDALVYLFFGVFVIFGAWAEAQPEYEQYCTPRTYSDPTGQPTAQSDQFVSQDTSQTCYRRAIYGGGGSGVGK